MHRQKKKIDIYSGSQPPRWPQMILTSWYLHPCIIFFTFSWLACVTNRILWKQWCVTFKSQKTAISLHLALSWLTCSKGNQPLRCEDAQAAPWRDTHKKNWGLLWTQDPRSPGPLAGHLHVPFGKWIFESQSSPQKTAAPAYTLTTTLWESGVWTT